MDVRMTLLVSLLVVLVGAESTGSIVVGDNCAGFGQYRRYYRNEQEGGKCEPHG